MTLPAASARSRTQSALRLLAIGVLVISAATGVSLGLWTGNVMLGLLVVLLGIAGASVVMQLRQNRSVHRNLHRIRGELRATRRSIRSATRRQGAVRDTDAAALSALLVRSQRKRAGKDAELSAQIATVSAQLRELAAVVNPTKPSKQTPALTAFSAVPGDQMLAGLKLDGSDPCVNLVLNSFTSEQTFAGVSTALRTATRAAARLGRRLRVIMLRDPAEPAGRAEQGIRSLIDAGGAGDVLALGLQISTPAAPLKNGFHSEDLWIATYWTTAVTIQQAVRDGFTRPDRVLYLVQDWEPGFLPWGAQHVLARNTYTAGFRLVVNSSPLGQFLEQQAGIHLPHRAIFAPAVVVDPLHRAARRWTPGDPDRPRVLFYARPSKPRNLYSLGVDALGVWASQLPSGVRPIVTLAGEDVAPMTIGDRIDVVRAGKTDLSDYYDLLARTDLGLALMYSPHPSHLALELPMAGIPTVTNEFDTARRPWVVGLSIAQLTPIALASALGDAWKRAGTLSSHTPQPPPDLGGSLEDAVDFALDQLGEA